MFYLFYCLKNYDRYLKETWLRHLPPQCPSKYHKYVALLREVLLCIFLPRKGFHGTSTTPLLCNIKKHDDHPRCHSLKRNGKRASTRINVECDDDGLLCVQLWSTSKRGTVSDPRASRGIREEKTLHVVQATTQRHTSRQAKVSQSNAVSMQAFKQTSGEDGGATEHWVSHVQSKNALFGL